ncbi:hypothetical protein CSB45_10385 [candidate division KSB3 bacterium]|uniref:Uncharacterized protein n=1 Tax=candidate division KSB3 bacterium TaxID=2044937 RepID=A0A2G6E3H4_9BACT|nr:MAG: hypothetical protein CSB45_10385 [candidate division KSB3 bacterium]PIE29178.1 MAG: hypothetical protein CSA57_10240 [candidate division KSB3 bacterium]
MPPITAGLPYRSLSMLLLLVLILWRPLNAMNAPEDIRNTHALQLSTEAREFMRTLRTAELTEDRYFGSMLLRMVNRPTLTEEHKVEILYAMLKSIGWSFSGAVRIPAYYDYFQVFGGYASSFLRYQKNLDQLGYDAKAFVEIARSEIRQHVMYAAHALLLAMLLDAGHTSEHLEEFLSAELFQQAQVPEIWLHYLAFAVVLSRNADLALKLGELLEIVESEEGQEDILCALGVFESDDNFARIQRFLHETLQHDYNQAVETALLIARRRLSPNEFYLLYTELLSEAKRSFSLKELRDRQFQSDIWRDHSKSVYLKVWDNFDLRIYDDGILLSYKDVFSDFM